jgi:hypothetical protein
MCYILDDLRDERYKIYHKFMDNNDDYRNRFYIGYEGRLFTNKHPKSLLVFIARQLNIVRTDHIRKGDIISEIKKRTHEIDKFNEELREENKKNEYRNNQR